MKNRVFLSIGSNVGKLKKNIDQVIEKLKDLPSVEVVKVSKYYKSTPLEFLHQNNFINCGVLLKTSLNIHKLHSKLQKIEKELGKDKKFENGPRKIDIDIIFCEDLVISTSDLQIPHQKMHERKFVLLPFMELDKDFVHPQLNLTIKELLKNLKDNHLQKVKEI